MVTLTHPRGSPHALFWQSQRDMWGLWKLSARPLLLTLMVAFALHLPMVPGLLSDWIRLLFVTYEPDDGPEGPQQDLVIPIELDMDNMGGPSVSPPPPPSAAELEPDEDEAAGADDDNLEEELLEDDDEDDDAKKSQADAGTDEVADAGAADAPDAGMAPDAGEAISTPDAGSEPVDAGAEPVDAGAPAPVAEGQIVDPYGRAGGAASVGPEHPNVRIFIAADVLRQHPRLAERFGDMLNAIPEWSVLLGGTEVNPIRDFDHLLIAGPQMRDPRWIWIALDYNIDSRTMRRAIQSVIDKRAGEGRWISKKDGLEVAAVGGGDAERRVVLMPDKRMLTILPAEAEAQIDKLRSPTFKFPASSGAGIVLSIVTPWRAFRGTGFDVPHSIQWMKLQFTPVAGGDFLVEVEGQDAAPEEARAHLDVIRKQVDARPEVLLALGAPSWEVVGDRIRGRVAVSPFKLRLIMGYAKKYIQDIADRRKKRDQRRGKKQGSEAGADAGGPRTVR